MPNPGSRDSFPGQSKISVTIPIPNRTTNEITETDLKLVSAEIDVVFIRRDGRLVYSSCIVIQIAVLVEHYYNSITL